MRVRTSIWLIVVVAIVLAIVMLLQTKKPITVQPKAAITNFAPQTSAPENVTRTETAETNEETQKSGIATPRPFQTLSKTEKETAILSAYNDVPIDFYGRLEDQFSNAVAGATVSFSVRIIDGHQSTTTNGQVVSDSDGSFNISGYHGQDLSLDPKKAGYALKMASTLFKYSHLEDNPFSPDASNPTVIRMWKLQGSQPLAKIDKNFKIPYTPDQVTFDLIDGQMLADGGDLTIRVNRPDGEISGRNPQDWSIDVQIADGGLIETSPDESSIAFQAPDAGYESTAVFHKNNGPNLVDRFFFMKSRNGQIYAKIHLVFGVNSNPNGLMYISFNGVANTNGSGNWEATAPQGQ